MISEGSCDTEDWSNDAEIADILKYMKSEISYYKYYMQYKKK